MKKHLKILVVVAHPDEAEEYAAGTLSLLADRGHHIKIVSITNGDLGHFHQGPEELKRRRLGEAYAAAEIIGVADYEVWDEHDGDLVDSRILRERMLRTIRAWRTDVIITFTDEGPGHNDNRLAGFLVRKSVGLATLPNACQDVPPLAMTPAVLRMVDYSSIDRHQADIAFDIGPVLERKLRACAAHASQFLEFAPEQRGLTDSVPSRTDTAAVLSFIAENWSEYIDAQPGAEAALHRAYGAEADKIRYAESFEIAPYGRAVSIDDVEQLMHDRDE